MNLGQSVFYEIWMIPANKDGYTTHVVTECGSFPEAEEWKREMQHKIYGTLEIVRVTTTRQIVG